MSRWPVWEASFNALTIRQDGDPIEVEGAVQFDLDRKFPN
jgi:hypothetical protein